MSRRIFAFERLEDRQLLATMATLTSLSVSASSVTSGQSVTLKATVTVATPNTSTPNGGTVTFLNGSTTLGTAPLNAGAATFQISTLPVGVDLLTASYGGNGTFAASSTQIGPNSIITTVAGNGTQGHSGDNSPATAAELDAPECVAVDAAGNLVIADYGNNLVREINHSTGLVTTLAGNGTAGYNSDSIQATAAELNGPAGVALDAVGDLFIADHNGNRIREVNLSTGVITTVAGNGTAGYNGDNIQATAAELNGPWRVAVDAAGDVFIADYYNNRIREINHNTGVITTVAGNGGNGYNGDNIQATAAELCYPAGVAVDSAGDLFIADDNNSRVREVNPSTGLITTIAGNGTAGYNGDNIQATAAELDYTTGVAVDSAGDVFIVDYYSSRIREVNHATGLITTIAGIGTAGYNGDSIQATAAELDDATGVAIDAAGNLLIADKDNDRIREVASGTAVTVNPASTTMTVDASSATYGGTTTLTATLTSGGSGVAGETVGFTLRGVNEGTAATNASGVATLSGASVAAIAVGTYSGGVGATFAGDSTHMASTATTTLTVGQATPTLTVSDAGGTHNGSPFAATAMVNGATSLEGVTPTVAYYAGSLTAAQIASATPFSGAPSAVGTYTVAASFIGSKDYTAASSDPVIFSISPAIVASTIDWTGGGNDNQWSDAANWTVVNSSPAVHRVPLSTDDVLVGSGVPVDVDVNVTVNSLQVEAGTTISYQGAGGNPLKGTIGYIEAPQVTNMGTIVVSSGWLAIDPWWKKEDPEYNSTWRFTNTGVIDLVNSYLTVSGEFDPSLGTIGGTGALDLEGTTVNLSSNWTPAIPVGLLGSFLTGPGTLTISKGNGLVVSGSTIDAAVNDLGFLAATAATNLEQSVSAASVINGPLTTATGATLLVGFDKPLLAKSVLSPIIDILGSSTTNAPADATLTIADGFTDNGLVEVCSVQSGSKLTVTSGNLVVANGGLLKLEGNAVADLSSLTIDGQGSLQGQSASTLEIRGSLLGNTTNVSSFEQPGRVILDGDGTKTSPQLLEVMEQDQDDVGAGYTNPLAYDNVEIGDDTYVELVDQSHNSPGAGKEAGYAQSLAVGDHSAFEKDGLNFYVKSHLPSPGPNPGPKPTPGPTPNPNPTPAPSPTLASPTSIAAVSDPLLRPGASGGLPNPAEGDPFSDYSDAGTPTTTSSRYGVSVSAGDIQEAMLLALNDLTIASTSVFDVGDLPAEPAPPQKADPPDVLPPRIHVTILPIPPSEPDAPLPSSHRLQIILLSATALIAVAGYVWWRCFVRPHRRLLDEWLFPPVPIEDPPDEGARPLPGALPREESEHANRE